ncbi:hypothetical protein FWH58_02235 [Candidatus Saccharibacteria bacterium]|nr:hypothetical protein [Candidatus Saccharibacteria bacterium]
MKNLRVRDSRESGQVSIITVIAFILLFSVVVISFSRIVVTASRQAVNDELAASAKAAAESGIEDAKRILSYCTAGNPACDMLNKPIEQSTCTTISGTSALMTALQRVVSGSSVKVGGANQEEYLCLRITMRPKDFLGSVSSNGESVVVPLRFVNADDVPTAPRTFRLQWHDTDEDSDGDAVLLPGSDLPSASQWSGANPAVLRAEFVAVPKNTSFNIETLVANTRAVTLRPSTSEELFGATKVLSPSAYNLDSWIAKTEPNAVDNVMFGAQAFLLQVPCQDGKGSGGYACSVLFTIPIVPGGGGTNYLFDTSEYDYYLRLQAIYQSNHFRLSAQDINGNDLYFQDVQASVDVTGRAGESLKRLSARLNPNNGNDDFQWWPDYVVSSAGKICKSMTILDKDGADNCVD